MQLFLCAILSCFALVTVLPMPANAAVSAVGQQEYAVLAKPGQKIPLGPGHYFTYGFAKPPKMGTAIMKVEIFTNNGKPDTSFTVTGDADMPSMRGAHAAGEKKFALSKKGVYLLPVSLVMLGDWEIRFTFAQKGKTILRGLYLFDL